MAVSKVVLNGETLIDTTQKTVTANAMLSGTTALKNDGTDITGTIASKSSSDVTVSGDTVTIPAGAYSSQVSKSVVSGSAGTPTATKGTVSNHSVTITPSVTNTTGYITGGTKTGTGVTVNVTELESGTKSITANGSGISVSGYSAVDVDVEPDIESLTVTPSTTQQVFNGYTKASNTPVFNYSFSSPETKNISPALTIGESYYLDVQYSIDGYSIRYTFSDIYTATSTAVDMNLACFSISNTQVQLKTNAYDRVYFKIYETKLLDGYLPVTVDAMPSGSATTPATTITANPSISVSSGGLITATASTTKSVTPTVSAGYVSSGTAGTITVSGSNTSQLSTQAGTTVTPTESEQTAVAAGKYTTGAVKVGAISSTYVGSDITQRDSDDLTASGATVTAPAGYYAETAAKSVASGTEGTPTATKGTVSNHSITVTPSVTNSAGYISGGTHSGTAVTVSASELVDGTLGINSSGTKDVTNYANVSVTAGSATTPATTVTANPSISVGSDGLITATVSATKSVTPTVSAGYVSGGTAGTITVSGSNTSQLTTQAAQTIHPSTTDQTIASGKYLTGAQTVKAVTTTNLTAANIKKDVVVKIGDSTDDDCVTSVTGTLEAEPRLTDKTVTPGDETIVVTKDTDIRSLKTTSGGSVSRTAGTTETMTIYLDPLEALVDNNEYRIFGIINVIDASDNILEVYPVDAVVTWNTTYQTIVTNDTTAYIGSVSIRKNNTTTASLRSTFQITGTYGYQVRLNVQEINQSYDGLNSVTVNPSKYSETWVAKIITRSITTINWPDNLTSIGAYAFAGCNNFNPESLPSSITSIGSNAFFQCQNLALTSLPSSISYISSYAFYGCSNLALTSLPSGMTAISNNVFQNCTNLALTSLPSGITRIYNNAFQNCTNLALTSLPSGISNIDAYAFQNCTNLALTSLPSGLIIINSYAFQNCTSLALTSLPSSVTVIQNYAFAGCTGITTISCNGTITTLGQSAFVGTSTNYPMQLTSASFPNMNASGTFPTVFGSTTANYACQFLEFVDIGSIGVLGSNAFANCYSLETLVLRRTSSITSLNATSAFTNTPMNGYNSKTGTVYVPSALINSYKTATNWSTLYNNGTVTFAAIEGSDYELD